MSTSLKTPGVYIKEISKLPPSVAQVETAIPAFVGYTEMATRKIENDLNMKPTRVASLLEYEQYFGGARQLQLSLKDDSIDGMTVQRPTEVFLMYYALQMYFANGGGPCYIVSVNTYEDAIGLNALTPVNKDVLKAGLDTLEKEDEPTLLMFPDAISISDEALFYALYSDALAQAEDLKDRFVIMDTYTGLPATIPNFRNGVAANKYGAVYYPHLNTSLSYVYGEDIEVTHEGSGYSYSEEKAELTSIKNEATNKTLAAECKPRVEEIVAQINATLANEEPLGTTVESLLNAADPDETIVDLDDVIDTSSGSAFGDSIDKILAVLDGPQDDTGAFEGITLAVVKSQNPGAYAQIQKQIQAMSVPLPPSAAMAGVYARVDSTQGVWKSPANTGLSYVTSLTDTVTHEEQQDLNVDTQAGKSVNVIRKFTGKGILVWGARTLDGNSNEWRYISVRRFFNMVEESVKKATERFVFEANDANTWIKVQSMIENFLNQQWRAGALAGATPKEAYYVSVGLDKTMTAQDILEGRMNVEIGMAAVRPAEFIILKFSHKLQES